MHNLEGLSTAWCETKASLQIVIWKNGLLKVVPFVSFFSFFFQAANSSFFYHVFQPGDLIGQTLSTHTNESHKTNHVMF